MRSRHDDNQNYLRQQLIKCDWQVVLTTSQGAGFPDAVCWRDPVLVLVEFKIETPDKPQNQLNQKQIRFHEMWRGAPIYIVRSQKVYSDEEIKTHIERVFGHQLGTEPSMSLISPACVAHMLQQLLEQRDEARKARDALIRELQKEQVGHEVRSQALSEGEAQARRDCDTETKD